ncbi:hypothetical protein G6F46_015553 [Rhizopus delemar]|nr:hypothetical protein G6F46_015553 [Rhizopus delemar]
MQPRGAVPGAGFQQAHGECAVGAQPVGHHASGRAGANHDDIHGVGHIALSPCCRPPAPRRRDGAFTLLAAAGRTYILGRSRQRPETLHSAGDLWRF